jgi:hypothetical protein
MPPSTSCSPPSASCSRRTRRARRRSWSASAARAADRDGELDARRLHRAALPRHRPAPAAAGRRALPAFWGTRDGLDALFGGNAASIAADQRSFAFRYRSAAHMLEVLRGTYGPVLKAFEALKPEGQAALEADMLALMARFNRAGEGALVVPRPTSRWW